MLETKQAQGKANEDQGQAAAQHADAGAGGANVAYSSAGPIPPVNTAASAAGPSASDRAYGPVEHGGGGPALDGPSRLRVTASGLNVRSAPDSHGDNVVGGVHHGDVVDGVAREGEWVRIQYKGKIAFVYGAYVE